MLDKKDSGCFYNVRSYRTKSNRTPSIRSVSAPNVASSMRVPTSDSSSAAGVGNRMTADNIQMNTQRNQPSSNHFGAQHRHPFLTVPSDLSSLMFSPTSSTTGTSPPLYPSADGTRATFVFPAVFPARSDSSSGASVTDRVSIGRSGSEDDATREEKNDREEKNEREEKNDRASSDDASIERNYMVRSGREDAVKEQEDLKNGKEKASDISGLRNRKEGQRAAGKNDDL